MPVLSISFRRIKAILACTAMLLSCSQGSDEYKKIQDLPFSQWNSYAASLPISNRLDLYVELMNHSGHNPGHTIVESFGSDPHETYDGLVEKVQKGKSNINFVRIIYYIDGRDHFYICDQKNRKIIQNMLSAYRTGALEDRDRPRFYDC
jgi:hypothetical protein